MHVSFAMKNHKMQRKFKLMSNHQKRINNYGKQTNSYLFVFLKSKKIVIEAASNNKGGSMQRCGNKR